MMRRVAFAALSAVLLAPVAAAAQLYLPGVTPDMVIDVNPVYPGPNQSVNLTARSALLDLASANITWIVNGKTIAQGVGESQVQIATGDAGSAIAVEADATAHGESASATRTISPESVDLLFDAPSYVPPFYEGRALPSPATPIAAEAVPHIAGLNGPIPPDQLTFTWRQDGAVLGSLSGRGRSSATLPPPPLFGASTISVEVSTPDGAYGASASARIPAIDPGITLYQDHPLFGIEYYNALAARGGVSDTEATFAAVPYFISAPSPDDQSLVYRWQVNGVPVATASSSGSEITINAAGASGPAALAVHLNSNADLFLDASGSWTVSFGAASGGFGSPLSSPASPTSPFQAHP